MRQLRLTVTGYTDNCIQGHTPEGEQYDVYIYNKVYTDVEYLEEGSDILLSEIEPANNGVWVAGRVIYEPDYLLDISTLSACFAESGTHPFLYVLNLLVPKELTHHILLGNTANHFLDDNVNHPNDKSTSFNQSILRVFSEDPLKFTVCEGINSSFFSESQKQFANISQAIATLHQHYPVGRDNEAILEPTFICPSLGVQGRLDYLQQNLHCLVELKSGKCEESYGRITGPKKSHAAQMMLYKEMLHINGDIPRSDIKGMLLYSRYPQFFDESHYPDIVDEALSLRNRIVFLMKKIATTDMTEYIEQLTPDMFNTRQLNGRLWNDYLKPQLTTRIQPFHTADKLTTLYFHRYLRFVATEQYLSKAGSIGRSRPFCNLWRLTDEEKACEGDIVTGMQLTAFNHDDSYDSLTFTIPQLATTHIPNFRKGDMVLFYAKALDTDHITNQQVFKGTLTEISQSQLTIALKQSQHNPNVFTRTSYYAMEHDSSDVVFTGLYKGLYSLLLTPEKRRTLFLGTRAPQTDPSVPLSGNYHDTITNHIVRTVKQSKDLTLIVGVPGAGKTSIVLRSIVEEYYNHTTENILLLAYTNRAVDEICEALEQIDANLPYIRISSRQGCESRYVKHTLDYLGSSCSKRTEMQQLIRSTRIYVSTVSSATGHPELFRAKHFGIAIIDEASQIIEPQLAGLFTATSPASPQGCAIEKFVLIGDHKQLPAVTLSTDQDAQIDIPQLRETGFTSCKQSLFERLYNQLHTSGHTDCIVHLNRQGRMHPSVCDFANRYFYDNCLRPIPLPHQETPLPYTHYNKDNRWEQLVATQRTAFIPVEATNEEEATKTNSNEAQTASELIKAISAIYKSNGLTFDSNKSVGIITPFRNQGACIRKYLNALHIPQATEISIDTVERYQGSQRDIIIYCTTIASASQLELLVEPYFHEGKLIDRKMNVALTRARQQLFVIGVPRALSQDNLYNLLMKEL